MADQEIAKHTKKVLGIMAHPGHGVWHKVREMLLEIIIIVFAVSLSIWLHSLGEHRHEQKQVRAFLLGLKQDIASDLKYVEFNTAFYRGADANFRYLASLEPGAVPAAGRSRTSSKPVTSWQ